MVILGLGELKMILELYVGETLHQSVSPRAADHKHTHSASQPVSKHKQDDSHYEQSRPPVPFQYFKSASFLPFLL